MKMAPLDIVDGSYADEDKSFSAQDTVNYLPTSAEQAGTRTPTMLKTPPGLKPAVLIGVNEGEAGMQVAGPVRGTYNAEGRFFAVAGNRLFQISSAGIAIPLGTVPGVGRVSFAHNQVTNGNEILVNNGNAGYIYSTVTQAFQRITDTSYPGGLKAVFINNRFVQIEPARRYAFNSALANGLEYTALDRFTSETSPDLLMSIESIGNQLAAFSATTTEWFEDTGASPQPFRSTGIVADKGAAGPFTTAKMDNQLFVLADDGVFYRFQGYNPVRISTKPIEQAIRGKNWLNAFTTVWEDSGFAVCYWTFPDGETWGYDASSGKWHRRESYGFNRWRLNSLTFWQNAWYGGDFQNGRLWRLDWDYLLEGDEEIVSSRAAGIISDNQNRVIHERLELVMNTGMEETVPAEFVEQPEGPTISGDAPDGVLGSTYGPYSYTVSGGVAPYRVTIRPGSNYPPGLGSITAGGTIPSSEPTELGVYEFTLRATDANGLFSEINDTISIGIGPMLALGRTLNDSSQRRLISSVDGINWSPIIVPTGLSTTGRIFAGHNFRFAGIIGGNVNARFTDDLGETWTLVTLAHGAGSYGLAVTTNSSIVTTGSGGINRSIDNGETWSSVGGAVSTVTIAKNADKIICLTSETRPTYSEDDGATWSTPAGRLDTDLSPPLSFQFSAFGSETRVMFGGSTSGGQPVIAYTDDGITFASVQVASGARNITALSYGDIGAEQVWLAGCSDGQIYRSVDDGLSWVPVDSSPGVSWRDIIFNGILFVAGGGNGGVTEIKTSRDGETWVSSSNLLAYEVMSIAQGHL